MRFLKGLGAYLSQHAHVALALVSTAIGLALFAFSGIAGNQRAGYVFLQDIEQRSLDLRFAIRGSRPQDPRIVIVGLDEKTLAAIGSYPIPRRYYALLVRKLKEYGARVVGFDMDFPTPASSEALEMLGKLRKQIGKKTDKKLQEDIDVLQKQADVDAQFADALKSANNVVLGHLFLDAERAKAYSSKLTDAYFNVIWAKPFPQVLKAASGRQDFDLAKAWKQAGGPVDLGVEPNYTQLAEAAASYGFFNIEPDADGILRRALFMIGYQDLYFPSLDLEILQQFEGIPDQDIQAYIAADGLERIKFGSRELRPWKDGTALINYVGPYNSYPHYSMADVLFGLLPADTFRDKIVLVGATALGIGDVRNTPFKQGSSYMGVEVHANILDNLLHKNEPHRTFLVRGFREELVDIGFIVLFGGLGLWFGRWRPSTATVTAVLVLGAFMGFIYFSFAHWGRWFSFVVPSITLVFSYLSATSFRVVFEEREKRRIRKSFSQYLSPDVIARIEKDPEKYIHPGGEMSELTIMFSDIRGFTSLSEGMSPDDLVRLLNEYFSAMTEILYKHLGTLDKYIGDAIMAFWGSPFPLEDHAYRACCCALEMVDRLAELNRNWTAQGRPEIANGIGLNTGPVNVGNIGSDQRLAWTVMGDNVNLASRLEGITKEYRVRVIISEYTYAQVSHQFVAREVDKIRVKGKKHPVTLYELLGPLSDRQKYEPLLTPFNIALEVYRTHKWQEAAGKFGQVLKIYPYDGPTQALLDRCMEFMNDPPPADWDGVYEMKSK